MILHSELSVNKKRFSYDNNGHPEGRAFLLYLGIITEKEAGFSFFPELEEEFETHVKSCNFCRNIANVSAEAYLEVQAKKKRRGMNKDS